ncbi:MAG: lysostaphin resistance A-like protein, partial [Oscillospiraceae bacterium]
MKNRSFPYPMKRSELVAGWIYLPIHIFILPILISVAMVTLFPRMGINLDDPHLNFAYYAISFIFVLVFMFRYLKNSFSDLIDNFTRSLAAVGLGFLMYYISSLAVNMLILYFTDNLTNPNTEIINSSTKLNVNMMAAVGVLLAPVVEESLFRGVVFGSLRKKTRVWAFIISALLFAVYHLWDSFLGG